MPGEAYERGGTEGERPVDSAARSAAARLERAFDRHLDRDRYADCARVVVHEGAAGRYEYVDGVHYVTAVEDAVRRRLAAFVERRDLTVVMDGLNGFAFRHEVTAPAADAHVAGVVVRVAFDLIYEDLDDVVEVLDGSTTLSWTEGDSQRA